MRKAETGEQLKVKDRIFSMTGTRELHQKILCHVKHGRWTMSLYPPPAASIRGVRPPGQFLLLMHRNRLPVAVTVTTLRDSARGACRCPGWAALDRRRPGAGLLCTAGNPEHQRKSQLLLWPI